MSVSKSKVFSAFVASTVYKATGADAHLKDVTDTDGFGLLASSEYNPERYDPKSLFFVNHNGDAVTNARFDYLMDEYGATIGDDATQGVDVARVLPSVHVVGDSNRGDGPDGDDDSQFQIDHRISKAQYRRFSGQPVDSDNAGEGFQKFCENDMCYLNDWLVQPWVSGFKKENASARPLSDGTVRNLCNNGYCFMMTHCLADDDGNAGNWKKLKECALEADAVAKDFDKIKREAEENKPVAVQPKKPLSQAAQELEGKVMSDFFEPVEWDDIKGLEKTKQELINTFELQYQAPQLFDQNSNLRKLKSILLYGPPGTGKTMMAKAVRTHASKNSGDKKIAFLSVTSSAILDKWVGSSGQNVAALFELARYHQPSVIFFDEFDALAPSRESVGNDGGAMMQVITELLAQMQGANNTKDENVLIIGATNRPASLDSAVMSRMEKHVYVPLPDERVRQEIILNYLAKETQPHALSKPFIKKLSGTWTNHFSARELDQLVAAVTKERSTDLHKAQGFIKIQPHPLYTENNQFQNEKLVATKKYAKKPAYAIYPIIKFTRDRSGAMIVQEPSKVNTEDLQTLALSKNMQLTPKEQSMYKEYSKSEARTTMKKTYKQLLDQVQELQKNGSPKKQKLASEIMKGLALQRVQERHFWAVRNEVTPQVTAAQIAELEEYNNQKQAGGAGHAEPAITPEVKVHLETVMQIYMQSGPEGAKLYIEKLRKLAENDAVICSKQTFVAVLFHTKKALRPDLDEVEELKIFGEADDEEDEYGNHSDGDDDGGNNVNSSLKTSGKSTVMSKLVGQQDSIMRGARKIQAAETAEAKAAIAKQVEKEVKMTSGMNVNTQVEESKITTDEDSTIAELKTEIDELKAQVLASVEQNNESATSSVSRSRSFLSRLFCNRC